MKTSFSMNPKYETRSHVKNLVRLCIADAGSVNTNDKNPSVSKKRFNKNKKQINLSDKVDINTPEKKMEKMKPMPISLAESLAENNENKKNKKNLAIKKNHIVKKNNVDPLYMEDFSDFSNFVDNGVENEFDGSKMEPGENNDAVLSVEEAVEKKTDPENPMGKNNKNHILDKQKSGEKGGENKNEGGSGIEQNEPKICNDKKSNNVPEKSKNFEKKFSEEGGETAKNKVGGKTNSNVKEKIVEENNQPLYTKKGTKILQRNESKSKKVGRKSPSNQWS